VGATTLVDGRLAPSLKKPMRLASRLALLTAGTVALAPTDAFLARHRRWRVGRAVRQMLAGATACASLGASASSATAQALVGHIEEVRGIVSIATCTREYAIEASRQSVSIIRQGVQLPAGPADSLLLADSLRVRALIDVRVRVDSGRFGSGNIYLAPELGRCRQADSALRMRGVAPRPNGDGSYSISSRRETTGGREVERLLLSVDNGVAYVQWALGPLSVIALGREFRVRGTEFIVVADSATRGGMLYVREGAVAFANGATDLVAQRDEAFTFDRQGTTTLMTVDATLATEAVYHSRDIWVQPVQPPPRPPWWARPRALGVIGATALAGGIITYIVIRSHDDSSGAARQGTIIVRLPL
jgi:hypothetical protein